MMFVLTIAIFCCYFPLLMAARSVQSISLPVLKDKCLSTTYKRTLQSSLLECGIFCLNDDICKAVEFNFNTGVCGWSNSANQDNCTGKVAASWSGVLANLVKPCPDGLEFCNADAGRYYEFNNSTASWSDASDACRQSGGLGLAVLDTEAKISWINEQRLLSTNDVRTSSLWIAGYDPYDNHTWIWDNANHDPVADSHWRSSEPNHIDDSYVYCIESYPESHDFKWNDARCTHNRGYICEFKL